MMPDLGKYAGTVYAAYAVTLTLLAALVLVSVWRARRVKAALEKVEARRDGKVNPLMLAPPVIFGALALVFFVGMQREDPDALPSALAGRAAPALTLSPLGELPGFDRATLDRGGVKLVNFWASWCAPCRAEHPNLEALAAEGVPIYGVNYKDKAPNATGFLDELGNPYIAVAQDETGRTGLDWGLYGVPETFVIDSDGTIVLRHAGPITERIVETEIRPAIEKARAGQ